MATVVDSAVGRREIFGPLQRAVRIGLRELRSGVRGFGVFIACLALGVAVIAAVGALSDALKAGFERQGEAILGGDITFARMHARATEVEKRAFAALGPRFSETATLRTMARTLDGSEQALAELKAVDGAYPLAGAVEVANGDLQTALRSGGAVVEPMLLERLQIKLGQSIRIGSADVPVAATLTSEPDSLADRLTYGPRIFVSTATLEKTGLIQPGTLVRWRYAIKLNDTGAAAILDARGAIAKAVPDGGFTVTDRRDPAPQVTRAIERLRQFLTLIGLASLLVGGIGVANSVGTFIERRLESIATLKSVGATSGQVFAILFAQVMAMALIGIVIGLAAGSAVPVIAGYFLKDVMPVEIAAAVSMQSLAAAALYGLLVALLFSLWPLGLADRVSPTVLFRGRAVADAHDRTARRLPVSRTIASASALTLLVLGALAVLTSDAKLLAVYVLAGLAIALIAFWQLGLGVTKLAARMQRQRRPELALAQASIASPDGLARSVILSLGIGLSLLVAVALTDHSIVHELKGRLPDKSPDYFLLDIPKADYPAIADKIETLVPGTKLGSAPMLRGRLVQLNGSPVETIAAPPEAQWVLNGDRGLSYAESVPAGSRVTSGAWWPADYAGEPLVSFDAELAGRLKLKVGDTVTVNVLGRNVTAKIANLREVHWESLNINFVMLFSPNTLRGAPHNFLATVSLPPGTTSAQEVAVMRALGQAYPSVSAIRVKDALDQVNRVFGKIMTAVRVAGSVTLLAGALVLAGALATAQRRRIIDAVILSALGATRRRILGAHVVEYLSLAAVAAGLAIIIGTLAAWVAVRFIMDLEFVFSASSALTALGLASALVVAFGLIGSWTVLRAPPVPYLKSE